MKKYQNLIFILVILVFSFFSWRSLTYSGYFSMHDDMQFMRIYELDKCLKDNQIPCRWVPDLGYGYGYPLFNYYSPFPYYLGEFFHLLGFSILDSVKIIFGLSLVLSGVFMFFLGKEFWGNWGGLLSALFYIYAPYRAVDVYVRGALAESWGMVWFPLVFFAVYKVIKEKRKEWIFLLGLSYGLLLLSHNIMGMLFSFASLIWGLFWLFNLKDFKKIKDLALGVGLGFGLSAFFILPALLEKKFVHTETMLMGYFNYLAHFANLKQLFLNNKWGWGASVWGPEDEMPFMIGYFHWILVGINFILAWIFWFKKKNSLFRLTFLLTFLFLFSTFMIHSRSTPIWIRIKFLEYLQFPWRFLGLVAFFSSFLAGAIFTFFRNKKFGYMVVSILIFGVLVLNKNYFRPEKFYFEEKDEDRLSREKWEESLKNAIFDYLPIYAHYPPAKKAPELPEAISGQMEILEFKKGTNWQEAKIKAKDEGEIQLPIYYFPEWKVWLDGKEAAINYDNFLGLITIKIPAGEHQLEAKLLDTPVRKIGNSLSLVSFFVLIFGGLRVALKENNERGKF